MLKVKIFSYNLGSEKYYGLQLAEKDNEQVLPYSPRWKTEKGAIKYAIKNNYTIIERRF